jgi:diguanylate cyclase
MPDDKSKEHWTLEVLLIVASLGIATMAYQLETAKSLVLHLYYLPVVLGGFYLGKYRAGSLALLCALLGGLTTFLGLQQISLGTGLLATGLEYIVWASTLGLTAVLVGTLSDERRRAFEKLHDSHKKDVLLDSLTGIANRRAFDNELARRLAEWKRYQTPFALMLVDIDHFKDFNDRYGHQAGDVVLRDVACSIEMATREADFVARFGGEEFCAILSGACAESAMEVAERVRSLIEKSRFQFTRLKLKTTVSVGVALITDGEDAVSLIQRTDGALYASKEAGRNCAHFHNGGNNERFGEGLAIPEHNHPDDRRTRVTGGDAYFDGDTDLPSRRVFLEELARRTSEAHRYGQDLAVWIVELDGYSIVADRDKRAARKAMVSAARLLRAGLREPDLVVRYSESQFAVLLPSTPFNSLVSPAQRIIAHVSRYTDLEYKWLKVTISIGGASLMPGESAASLLEKAQSAVKSAILEGGNQLFFDGEPCVAAVTSETLFVES